LGNEFGNETVQVEVELLVELCMAVAVSFSVKKREVVHVYLAASAFSFAVAREQPEQVIFLAIVALFFSCCGPDSQVLDVLDDISEGLPVSLVEHVLVDGRKASMIVPPHLVDVNRSVGWSDEVCFRFARQCGNGKKKNVNSALLQHVETQDGELKCALP